MRYAEKARDVADVSENLAPTAVGKALGEYALAVYLLQQGMAGAVSAYGPWSNALKQILAINGGDIIWKDAMVLFGHVTGFLAGMARDGKPPSQTCDGNPWAPPYRGMFCSFKQDRVDWYRPGGEAGLFFLMSEYAKDAADQEGHDYWLRRAMEESRNAGMNAINAMLLLQRVPDLITADLYEQAIEAAYNGGRSMVALRQYQTDHPLDRDAQDLDLIKEFEKLTEEVRHQGDASVVIGVDSRGDAFGASVP